VYLDFYETTPIVDLAIDLSQGFYYQWFGNQKISQMSNIDPRTETAPGMGVLNAKLYMLYRGDEEPDIYFSSYDAVTWSGNKKISDVSDISPKTSQSPAVANYGGQLYILYRGDEEPDIYLMTFNGAKWAVNKRISEISDINPKTATSPALAVFNNLLYVLYRGREETDIYVTTFNGVVWSGNKRISEISGIDPKTETSPAVAVFKGRLYMLYRGHDRDDIYLTTHDGMSWTGNRMISEISEISPQTDTSPAVSVLNNELFVLYRGVNKSDIYQMTFDGTSWNGNVELSQVSPISPKTDDFPGLVAYNTRIYMLYRGENEPDIYQSALQRTWI
jgi:hypothetical protein